MKLADYLRMTGLSPERFSAICDLAPTTIRGIIEGKFPHASTAKKIVKASGKKVKLGDLRNAKRRPYTFRNP